MTGYEWRDTKGDEHSFTISYPISEYLKYKEIDNVFRGGHSFEHLTDFVIINNIIEQMSDAIAKEYLKSNPESLLNDQAYAEFILLFVQKCFDYPPSGCNPDVYIYCAEDY